MKIDPISRQGRSENTNRRKVSQSDTRSAFRDVLSSAKNSPNNELEELLETLEQSGEYLKENPRLENFEKYRDEVRQFVKSFLESSYDIKLTSEMTMSGRKRHMVIVKKIDDNLENLYHLFLREALDLEELASGIEEVMGMILDLYR